MKSYVGSTVEISREYKRNEFLASPLKLLDLKGSDIPFGLIFDISLIVGLYLPAHHATLRIENQLIPRYATERTIRYNMTFNSTATIFFDNVRT